MRQEHGFTLIELLVAMALFCFVLLIISAGFLNLVNIHNQVLANNMVQSSASNAMDQLVNAVRDSSGVTITPGPAPLGISSPNYDMMCVNATSTGIQQLYYVTNVGSSARLLRKDGCVDPALGNWFPMVSSSIRVASFKVQQLTSSTTLNFKPEIEITLKLGLDNGTTDAAGDCFGSNNDRVFCAVTTLTSGAIQR